MNEAQIKLVLAASRIPADDGSLRNDLFVLGPFAEGVNFLSQQHRALNLVWALRAKSLIKPGAPVAVVGAGMAGSTAAMALYASGCDVTVYEKGAGILARQRGTAHRVAHPTINCWPHQDLQLTTRLPFLEWHADLCSRIVLQIEDQWEKHFPPNKLVDGVAVTGLERPRFGGVKLAFSNGEERPPFQLVILAVGFGSERPGSGDLRSSGYWSKDDLDGIRNRAPNSTFVVSGFGDGGLIDALRILHFDFEEGALVVRAAQALEGSEVAAEVRRAEDEWRTRGVAPDEAYDRAVAALIEAPEHQALAKILDRSLRRAKAKVILADRALSTPYAGRAAPIHKLLIAHAERHNRVFFEKGELQVGPDGRLTVSGRDFDSATTIVIRHGAVPEFDGLLKPDQIKGLRDAQTALADYQADLCWLGGGYPLPGTAVAYDVDDPSFRADRRDLAEGAVRFHDKQARLGSNRRGYTVTVRSPVSQGFPATLFGVPLHVRRVQDLRRVG